MSLLAGSQVAEGQSIQGPSEICPNTQVTYQISNPPANNQWTWIPEGLGTTSGSGTSITLTSTSAQGVFTLRVRYISQQNLNRSTWIPNMFNWRRNFIRSATVEMTKRVRVRFPEPKVPKLQWCSPVGTKTITIEGLQNNATDCNFNGRYEYVIPQGWADNCPFFQSDNCDGNTYTTESKTIEVTPPSNLADGEYRIPVTPIQSGIRYPTSDILISVGAPPKPSGTMSAYALPKRIASAKTINGVYYDFEFCVDEEALFSFNGDPVPHDLVWSVTGPLKIVSPQERFYALPTSSTYIEFIPSVLQTGTISLRYRNDCNYSVALTKKVYVHQGECPNLGSGLPKGTLPIFPGTDQQLSIVDYNPKILNKDAFDYLHVAFIESNATSDTTFIVDHRMGFHYLISLTKLGNSLINLTSDTLTTQYARLSLASLEVGEYEVEIKSYEHLLKKDTIKIWSSCNGTCFLGTNRNNEPSELVPVVYPIPGTNDLNIQFTDNTGLPPSTTHNIGFQYTVKVYDLLGVEKLSYTSNFQISSCSVSSLTSGNYVVKISDGVNLYSYNYIKQ
jgi:hypothetical protein